MWKLVCLILSALSVIALADPIHFDEVNAGMKVIADAVVFGDDLVDYARPEFDTVFSDLKAERLKYSLKGTIKNSPWLTGTRSEITASSALIADRNPEHMGISCDSDVTVKTDVLSMLRQAATIALRKARPSGKYEARIIDTLKQMSEVTSLAEVKKILDASKLLGLEAIHDEIGKQREYLACLKSHNCGSSLSPEDLENSIHWAERHLDDLLEVEKSTVAITIDALPSEQQVKMLKIVQTKTPETHDLKWDVKPSVLTVEISEEAFKVSVSGFKGLKKQDMDKLKSELTEELAKFQSGDLDQKEKTFRNFRDALYAFKDAIRGDNIK